MKGKGKRYNSLRKKANIFDAGGVTNIPGVGGLDLGSIGPLGSGGAAGTVAGTGDIVNTLSGGQKLQSLLGMGTGKLSGVSGIGGIANTVGNAVSGLINPSGNSTGVGNALQTVGGTASAIPGVGGLIGAGVGLVGGLVNAMFGSNINEEFVEQTRDNTDAQRATTSDARDNASLLSDWSSYSDMAHVRRKDVGSDGWFSDKAKNLTKELNRNIDTANAIATQNLVRAGKNVDNTNDALIKGSYYALGGLIPDMSAINYDFTNRKLFNDSIKAQNNNKVTGLPNYWSNTGITGNLFGFGGDTTNLENAVDSLTEQNSRFTGSPSDIVAQWSANTGISSKDYKDATDSAVKGTLGGTVLRDIAEKELVSKANNTITKNLISASAAANNSISSNASGNYFDNGGELNGNNDGTSLFGDSGNHNALLDIRNDKGTQSDNGGSTKNSGQDKPQSNTFIGGIGEKLGVAPEIGDLFSAGISLLPFGSLLGLADLGRDVYHKATGSRDVGTSDLLFDLAGIIPGYRVLSLASKGLKGIRAGKAAAKVGKFANLVERNTTKGVREAARKISEATNKATDAAIDAALERNRNDMATKAFKAANYGKASKAVADDIYNTMGTFPFQYNQVRIGANAANATSDGSEGFGNLVDYMIGDNNEYSDGGKIHIKPSKKGTFTAAAKKHGKSVQAFANQVLANKENYSPAMVRKANFARNFGGKKKSYGGNLFEEGGPTYHPETDSWTNTKGQTLNMNFPYKMRHGKGTTKYLPGGIAEAYDENGNLIERRDRNGRRMPSYIGGSPNEARQKLSDIDTQFTDSVKAISGRYGADPDVVASRIAAEGPVDRLISKYNMRDTLNPYDYSDDMKRGPSWGLDDLGDDISNGNVNIREPWFKWEDFGFINEKGRNTNSAWFGNWSNGISATAAELEYRKKEMKKRFPDATDEELDTMALGAFNRGIEGMTDYVRKGGNINKYAPFIKLKDKGGPLSTHGGIFSNGLTYINEGGTHEENPFEGVQMGVDAEGIPNLVEEGEVVFNDYVFSNRMKVPKDVRKRLKLRGDTFAEAAKELSKESEERPNDPISKNGLDAFMSALSDSQEELRMKNEDRRNNRYAKGGKLGKRFDGLGPDSNWMDFGTLASPISWEQIERMAELGVDGSAIPLTGTGEDIDNAITRAAVENGTKTGNKSDLSYLRFAPAVMSGISAFSDIFSKPDYSAADRVASIDIQPALVSADPVGQYLSYRPLDRMFYINQLNKNAAATRRAVNNNSGGNRATALAGILAADSSYGENLGKLARQAEEYNQSLKEKVATFNRATDMFNSQQSMQAQTADQASRNSATQMRLAQAERVAQLRQAARDAYDARRSDNLNSFITNLGNIGLEDYQREMINSNPALYYMLSGAGSVGYKGTGKKNGGKLKKKRRNTYA